MPVMTQLEALSFQDPCFGLRATSQLRVEQNGAEPESQPLPSLFEEGRSVLGWSERYLSIEREVSAVASVTYLATCAVTCLSA